MRYESAEKIASIYKEAISADGVQEASQRHLKRSLKPISKIKDPWHKMEAVRDIGTGHAERLKGLASKAHATMMHHKSKANEIAETMGKGRAGRIPGHTPERYAHHMNSRARYSKIFSRLKDMAGKPRVESV